MAKQPAYSPEETAAIHKHLDRMAAVVQANIDQFRKVPKSQRGLWEEGQLRYWTNAKGAIKWLKNTCDSETARETGSQAYGS